MEYPDGSIIAFYTNVSDHNLDGWSEYSVSKDRGKTWNKYQKFRYCFEAYRKNPQRSAWVQEGLVTNKGTGVVFVSHWENDKRVRIVFMRSHDYGSTWSDAQPVDGNFIGAPAAVAVSGDTNYILFDCDGAKGPHVLYASTDDGKTWRKRSALPLEKPAWYGALCLMEDGSLLAGAYVTADEDHLHYCISQDGGRTWSRQKRTRLDRKIRDPELAFIGGKYYLHGRSGHKGKGANRFVLYQSDDGIHWKSGLIVSAERGGYDGYSHNCVINKYDPDTPNELMIEYSVRYSGRDTNTYVFFVRPRTESRQSRIIQELSRPLRFDSVSSMKHFIPVLLCIQFTKPFTATGDQLLLNVDVHDGGNTKVEVLHEDMQRIEGFELSSSVPLHGRSIEQTVRWTTKAKWRPLAGRKVRLRVRLRNADLYAFWTAKEE